MPYMNNLHYNLLFKEQPEGGYMVTIPSLPGCFTYGKDIKEAKEMAIDAIKAYLASLEKHGESIPTSEQEYVTSVDVEYVSSLT